MNIEQLKIDIKTQIRIFIYKSIRFIFSGTKRCTICLNNNNLTDGKATCSNLHAVYHFRLQPLYLCDICHKRIYGR